MKPPNQPLLIIGLPLSEIIQYEWSCFFLYPNYYQSIYSKIAYVIQFNLKIFADK